MCVPLIPGGIYDQCGGGNFDGFEECGSGLVCKVLNEFYSQCVLDEDTNGVKLWEQCGGEGFDGPTNCQVQTKCVVINQYYSQCEPR